jgi:competence protein ComEC
MTRLGVILFSAAALTAALGAAQTKATKGLEIYVVDTEGGKAALFVSPAGESLLIDSGNPGERDPGRIMQAVSDAGLKKIDYLLSTHYHVDHIGGMQELAKRIPIGHYLDHGPTVEEREQVAGFQQAYAALYGAAKHTVVKPGDRIPIAGLDWRIVTAAGAVLKAPLTGGGRPNPACAMSKPKENTRDPENGQSVGSVITYGQFRAIDLGDLLWNNELDLTCPNNPIGTVDLYLVSHHGLDVSGSEALVHGVRPRVAVMANGTRKGAGVQAMPIMRTSPGLEDIWQLHWSYTAGIEQNSAGTFIANVEDTATLAATLSAPPRGGGAPATSPAAAPATGTPTSPPAGGPPPAAGAPPAGRGGAAAAAHSPAYWIKITAETNGNFTVTNSRNGFSKTYVKRTQ